MSKSIKEALQYVADHPQPKLEPLNMPVWEHVARALFDMANNPNPKVRGAMTRATKAQAIILDRMVGRRRAGSRPRQPSAATLSFYDLTTGLLESEPDDE